MKPENNIWIFIGEGGRFPSSAFTEIKKAEEWMSKHQLTGMLSAMPINQGLFEWAVENDLLNIKPEKLVIKQNDPDFIGTFTTATLDHYHYKNGIKE
ncbi:DUF7710 domain-containing protein [Spartinivicinus ruber]|uniref:DUF7710 domain-containing protein n=1 Tax=Spartinivicinus ruber TaxID=2683272 RepID=UPI001CA4671C|nr:hypothetical protein [Spartinivicinus ruber]